MTGAPKFLNELRDPDHVSFGGDLSLILRPTVLI